MAVVITAPVAATHSGESDPALYPISEVGVALPDVVGTMDTSAGNFTVSVAGENGTPVSATFVATLLAFTTAAKFSYVPTSPGLYTITVKDVTSGASASVTVEVFGSEGL